MIVKKVPNPKKSSTKSRRISDLVDYILAPQTKDSNTKCVFSLAHGFICEDVPSQKKEMISLSSLVKKSPDTVRHYVLSFQSGEHPTEEQFHEMVEIFATRLGWKDHQLFAALHTDTDNHHIHVAINRVHSETEKVVEVNRGKDLELGLQAIALIEKKQGWKSEKNAVYHVFENGEVARNTLPEKKKSPGPTQQDMELRTGEKSAQRIGQERATDILRDATSWRDLHIKMTKEGFRYERFGSGAKIFIGDIGIKASAVENGNFGTMEKRLGPFEAFVTPFFEHKVLEKPIAGKVEERLPVAKKISDSKIILESSKSWTELHKRLDEKGFRFEKTGSGSTVFFGAEGLKSSEISRKGSFPQLQKRLGIYQPKEDHGKFITHPPKPNFSNVGAKAGHDLPKLSERRLAHIEDGRIEGILQINVRVDRSKLERVRWQSQPTIIEKTGYIREPLRNNTEGWNEYDEARARHKSDRRHAIKVVDAEHQDEMMKLRSKHKISTKKYLSSGWVGRGMAFNVFKSFLAAEHAKEMSILLYEQRIRKECVMHDNPAQFPPIEKWQKNRGRHDLAKQWRANKLDPQDILGDSDEPPRRRDIRDFSPRVDGEAVAYYKSDDGGSSGREIGFVDHGRKISVHDWRDEGTTLAALQLASQKFGKFTVTGGDEYKKMCVKLAAENGLKITNPELQDAIAQEKIRISQERTAASRTKEFREFEKYHAAVGADRYRITARKPVAGAPDKLFLIGDGGMRMKGVAADRVALKVGEMIHLAKQGQKIEMGPFSKNVHHFVIHGITSEKLKSMERDGYRPSVIMKTEDGLHTAVINMKKVANFNPIQSARMGELLSEMYGSGVSHGPSHPAPGFLQAEILNAVKTECTKIVELAHKVIDEIENRRAGKAPFETKAEPAEVDVLAAAATPSSLMLARPTLPPRPAKPTI